MFAVGRGQALDRQSLPQVSLVVGFVALEDHDDAADG